MTRYTESIRANANKTEKEQLVSLMEKFNISLKEARKAITKEIGDDLNSHRLIEAYWYLKLSSDSEEGEYAQEAINYVNLGDDW